MSDFSSYKVANSETSSATKFNNLVQAVQNDMNALPLSQLAQGGATAGQALEWSGSVWAPATLASAATSPGTEIDYKQITSDVTGITATTEGTAAAVITGNTVAYDGTKVRVEFWLENFSNTGAANTNTFVLLRDATVLGQVAVVNPGTGLQAGPVYGVFYDTPAVGNHAYALKAFVGANSLTVKAGAGGSGALLPSFLRTVKA